MKTGIEKGILPCVRFTTTGSWRERIDLSLGDEGEMGSHVRLRCVKMLKSILLLMFPVHMLLLIEYRIPPHIKQTIGELRSSDKEGPQVEPITVLGNDDVDRRSEVVTSWRSGYNIEEVGLRGMREIERIVHIDISVDVVI